MEGTKNKAVSTVKKEQIQEDQEPASQSDHL
jgi:hypothetical protein